LSEPSSAVPPPVPQRAPRRRALRIAAWTLAGIGVAVIALVALVALFAGSETGLPYVLGQLERYSGGRLTIEGAQGSLWSKLNVATLRWKGDATTIVARDVVVEWDPGALTRRELHVIALGARTIDIAVAPSAQSAGALPRSLGLPLGVVVEHASVTTLDWALGARKGRATGIAFTYRGDAAGHRLDGVTLAFARGRIVGNVRLDAASPFALAGAAGFTGSDDWTGIDAQARMGGTLARIDVDAQGAARDARFDARVRLTPFAAAPIDTLDVDATAIDPATFDAAWPHASLAVGARARPTADGFAGTLSIVNAAPGALDADRLPLSSLASSFAQRGTTVELTGIDARLGNGRAHGQATLALDHGEASADLALEDVDLRALHGALAASRVSGGLRARVDAAAQAFDGDLADRARGLALNFAARVENRRVTLTRARLVAAAGTLDGKGQLAFDGARAFTFAGTAARFDPSRLGQFPRASLDGTLQVAGTLAPAWTLVADAKLGGDATIGGLAARGTAHAALAAGSARDVAVELAVGDARLALHGNAGRAGDALAFTLDVPQVAAVARLLPGDTVHVREGALAAHGTLAIEPAGVGGSVVASAQRLVLADGVALATLALDANVGAPSSAHQAFAERGLAIDATATGVVTPARAVARVHAHAEGTLAAHQLTLDVVDGADRAHLAAHGALVIAPAAARAWRGSIDAFELAGAIPAALGAPATLEWTPARTHVGAARIDVAGGSVALEDLAIDAGRISTRGTFDALPLATLATLAGHPLPVASTLTLGGRWNVAASPRLDGTLVVERTGGDLYAAGATLAQYADYPLGVRTLALEANVRADAWTLSATLSSLRAGDARLQATLAAGPAPGVPSPDAALSARLEATLASLAPMQPWLGTSAVIDGRAELRLTADGTLRAPRLSGTLEGSGLHVDVPQWGVALADGRVRATLSQDTIVLEQFTFKGGDGTLDAKGTLARASAAGGESRITWRADKFRLQNRPDARIIVSGNGAVAFAPQKLAVSGSIRVDEGRVVYAPPVVLLGDDVVIKGRSPDAEAPSRMRVPVLDLDLDVDLGRALTFSGEGLETGLGGRVRVTTSSDGRLDAKGTITAVRGTYYAFGQRLTIERGRLIFDGPLDNPALDIVALRKNLAVEAGVELTGTVKLPRVQLTSNPPVPDSEKLSWLVTGQAPGTGSAADAAALAAASSWLLGGADPRPIGTRIAQNIGLDEISLESRSTTATPGASAASGQVVSIGKRLSNRLTLAYEQGLTIATNALRLEYTLSRTLTLRAEAGTMSSIGINYRRSFP
jgi:translocation and assembly module TamB